MSTDLSPSANYGGLLFPLDMFRPTVLASVVVEAMSAKLRSSAGSELILRRHPEGQLVLLQLEGGLVGDDPAAFWRENMDLALYLSQALPRQVFAFYVANAPEARQGFVVAQQGQGLAGDEADADQMPPEAGPDDWPVARLAQQIGLRLEELEGGFRDGPEVRISLDNPTGDDRAMLMTLAEPPEGDPDQSGLDPDAPASEPPATSVGDAEAATEVHGHGAAPNSTAAGHDNSAGGAVQASPEDDSKRREREAREEAQARADLATRAGVDLPFAQDELGLIVAPAAELEDTDILAPYVRPNIDGELPESLVSLGRELGMSSLLGKRLDFVVAVQFYSEVFGPQGPLSKQLFLESAQEFTLGSEQVRALEVQAPRLGSGTYLRRENGAGVFISRPPSSELPATFLIERLDAHPKSAG